MKGNQAGSTRRALRDKEAEQRPSSERRKRVAAVAPALPEIAGDEMTPQVRSAVMQLMGELDRLKDELVAANERVSELEDMADEDPLVPVLNRRGFERELERTLAYVKRYDTEVALIYLDLDDFKGVNDRYGHAGGDAALKHFAAILLENVRQSDMVGRLGGDEFAIVLHHADDAAASAKAAQLTEQVAGSPAIHESREIRLGATAGVTPLNGDDTVKSALERADQAMYEGKAARRLTRSA